MVDWDFFEDHLEVPREGKMEAQKRLIVFHVKSKDLNQESDRATWDGGAFKCHRDHWGRSY